MPGPKLNEAPVMRRRPESRSQAVKTPGHLDARRGPLRPHLAVQGPPGARPHPRLRHRAGQGDPQVLRARRRHRRGQAARLGRRQRRARPRHGGRRAVRVRLLRRRGPHAQALAPPGPRPGHPHPQAHVPHHRAGLPPARPRAPGAPGPPGPGHHRRPPAPADRRRVGHRAAGPAHPPAGRGAHAGARRGRAHRGSDRSTRCSKRPTDETVTDETTTDDRLPRSRTTTTRMPKRSRSNGPEGQPLRVPPGRHHGLEVPVVQRRRTTRPTSSRTGRSATTS